MHSGGRPPVDDQAVVAAQIGRPLRAAVEVEWRGCPFDLPVVVRVPPLLEDGTPFPTRHWLSCPLAVRRIGRLESAGGVQEMDRRAARDWRFAERLGAAHRSYSQEREAAVPPEARLRPRGGVGGAEAGVKCLHAHYAHLRSGADNPVGELTAASMEPLDCSVPCVMEEAGAVVRNPQWREPR